MATMRPQIITTRNVIASFTAPTGARTGAMIGTAQWGAVDTVTAITTMSGFVSTFGNDISGSSLTLIKGADLFFRNGGSLKVVRIADSSKAESDLMLVNAATDMINIVGKYAGTYGNNISVTVAAIGSNMSLTITDGVISEYYSNNGVGYTTNALIATAINAGSALVTAEVETGQEANLIAISTSAQLTGGNDGTASLADADYTDALDNLFLTESYNFLMIPGKTDNSFQATVAGKLDARASSEKQYSRYISGVIVDESIATINARTASSKRFTRLAPSVTYTHRTTNASVNLDGSYTACAYAGLLCALDLNTSGTHETISVNGVLVNSTTGKEFYNKLEQEQLLNGGTAPVSKIGNAIQLIRGITTYSDQTSVWVEEVIVDIIDEVVTQCETYLNSVIGKPNTAVRRSVYGAALDGILTSLRNQGVIEAFNQSQVVEGSSADTIIANIAVKPTYNTNFVNLTLDIN